MKDNCQVKTAEVLNNIRWKDKEHKEMQLNTVQDVVYLTYPTLTNTNMVIHGFTTRLGGVSKGIYSSMNLSFTRGDEEEAVR